MIIEPKHFAYLSIQRGEVARDKGDFAKWKVSYEKSLAEIMASIQPALPARVTRILDIGGGLGGIDLLLQQHYAGVPDITILDGIDCPPVVESSFKPFSNAAVAKDFHKKNSNDKLICVWRPWPEGKYDLVVSFAAWCFHIHPGDYIDDLKRSVRKGSVIILDVRKTKRDWLEQLLLAFGAPKVLLQGEKFVRLAFNA